MTHESDDHEGKVSAEDAEHFWRNFGEHAVADMTARLPEGFRLDRVGWRGEEYARFEDLPPEAASEGEKIDMLWLRGGDAVCVAAEILGIVLSAVH